MTTLAASFMQNRRTAVVAAVGFTVVLALAAQITIPIPGTPVPITLQPMIVVLAGMMLGPSLGAASMGLYLLLGAFGAPVFSPVGVPGIGRFFGPTGGYLIAYPVAAYTAGLVAARLPSLMGRWLAAVLGIAVMFVGGLAQLTIQFGSLERALALGLTPFAALDVIKAFGAAVIARPRARTPRD
jgi:biotin transport system substrate-specific component